MKRKFISMIMSASLFGISVISARADEAEDFAFIAAVKAGDAAAVAQAIEVGANVNAKSEKGAPALVLAVLGKNRDLVMKLLQAGAEPDAQYMDHDGATALMLSVTTKDMVLAAELIAAGANVNFRDTNGDTAINWAAYYGDKEFVTFFLQNGASTKHAGHGNAREIVMRRGFQDLAVMLARHDKLPIPSPDAAILVDAIEAGDLDGVMEALIVGISPNSLDFSARPVLALAARKGNIRILEALVNRGAKIDAKDEIGFTALMEAARDGQMDAAIYLLGVGASPRQKGKPSALSLGVIHMAALSDKPEMVSLIVEAGADINLRGRDGGTALAWCLGENKSAAAAKLLALGANPYIKNKYNYSAADMINRSDSVELKALLKPAESFGLDE